jgi:hypothetical protein
MKINVALILVLLTAPSSFADSTPDVIKISGTTSLDKILMNDGSDPHVFQCLECSFDVTFQKFGTTGKGNKTVYIYASKEFMTDPRNNPLEPSMTLNVPDPTSYFSAFILLQINPAKDEAFIGLQTSEGFNANPLGFHAVAIGITTTIESFSKILGTGLSPVSFQEGVWSANGLDQDMGTFSGTIQISAP